MAGILPKKHFGPKEPEPSQTVQTDKVQIR